MGLGAAWSAVERKSLAASLNPTVGAHQKGTGFWALVGEEFDKRRDGPTRTARSVVATFKVISADYQKFRRALRLVVASEPTGSVGEAEIKSMAIAIHIGATMRMDYSHRSMPHSRWANHLAYEMLKVQPKWTSTGDEDNSGDKEVVASAALRLTGESASAVSVGSINNGMNGCGKEPKLGRPLGKRALGSKRRAEESAATVKSIALSLARSADARHLKADAAMILSFDDDADPAHALVVKQEFFALQEQMALHSARTRAAAVGVVAACPTTTPSRAAASGGSVIEGIAGGQAEARPAITVTGGVDGDADYGKVSSPRE